MTQAGFSPVLDGWCVLVPLSSLLAVSLIFAFKLLYLSLKFIINL
jgi:hypothetical protein